jgi:hypothetical protein
MAEPVNDLRHACLDIVKVKVLALWASPLQDQFTDIPLKSSPITM